MSEFWNQKVDVSTNKLQVFHFTIKLSAEDNDSFISLPVVDSSELNERLDEIQKRVLDVHIQRKKEPSESES